MSWSKVPASGVVGGNLEALGDESWMTGFHPYTERVVPSPNAPGDDLGGETKKFRKIVFVPGKPRKLNPVSWWDPQKIRTPVGVSINPSTKKANPSWTADDTGARNLRLR